MRLIDADALKAYFFRPYSNEETYSNIEVGRMIDAQPTIEPERKKGKWLLFDGYRCSICNYKLQTTGIPQYCPNCGADMRGDSEK